VPGGFGVRRPDRSARIPPGAFTQDPGMRARDEFTDVSSEGYNEWAKRAAERGGAEEYATSVEEEQAAKHADELRTQVLLALLMSMGVGGVGAVGRAARPLTPFQRGTLGQTGAQPGVGRALFGRPSARQASANRGIGAGSHSARDTVGILDEAFRGPGGGLLGRAWGGNLSGPGAQRRLRDTAWSRFWRG